MHDSSEREAAFRAMQGSIGDAPGGVVAATGSPPVVPGDVGSFASDQFFEPRSVLNLMS